MGEDGVIILFDLDGTLIDSTEAILESFHTSLDLHGFGGVSDEQIKALIGYPLDIMFAKIGVESEKVWSAVDAYREHYRPISTQKTVLLEGASEAVKLASSFAELGVVTTKTALYSRELMEHFLLMDYFKTLVGKEDVTNPKPHPEPILKALEAFKTQDKQIYMIGDTKLDLLSAKSAGVKGLGVLSGYGSRSSLEEHTDIIFDNALDAVRYLNMM